MIATHEFVKKPSRPNCEHKLGTFICGQPRELHKKPKRAMVKNKTT